MTFDSSDGDTSGPIYQPDHDGQNNAQSSGPTQDPYPDDLLSSDDGTEEATPTEVPYFSIGILPPGGHGEHVR